MVPGICAGPLVSAVVKAVRVIAEQGGTMFSPSVRLTLVAPALLAHPQLSVHGSALLVSGWGETKAGPSLP